MDLLVWAGLALIVAVIAGALGFSGVAKGAALVAKWMFAIFLVLFLVTVALIALGVSLVF